MIEIGGKDVLIVGGGRSAFHKVRAFLGFGARITVIAENISPDIFRMSGEIVVLQRAYKPEDLEGRALVVAATDDRELNRRIAETARQSGVMVNAVDDKDYCDFIFPAILRKENYSVAVSTDGKSPMLAARIRNQIASDLPDSLDEAVGELGRMREDVLSSTSSAEERGRIFKEEIARRLGNRKVRIGTRSSALAMAQTDLVILASASGARAFFDIYGPQIHNSGLPGFACIGRYTAKQLREYGAEPLVMADVHTADGLAASVKQYFDNKGE